MQWDVIAHGYGLVEGPTIAPDEATPRFPKDTRSVAYDRPEGPAGSPAGSGKNGPGPVVMTGL